MALTDRQKLEQAKLLIDEVLVKLPPDVVPDTTTRNVFGNSIARGFGATVNWPTLRGSAKGWPVTNNAVNGAMAWDQVPAVLARTVQPGDRAIVSLGTNDLRQWGVANIPVFQRAHRALIAWLATPEANKVRGKTLAGTGWANTYAYGIGKASSTPGAFVEGQFDGDTLLVGSIAQIGNTGAFDVYVDGVLKASVSCGASVQATINGAQYGHQLEVVTGCGGGAHTVRFVVTSSAGMAYVEWFGTPSTDARVDVYNTPVQVGATTVATDAMCAAQLADVQLLQSLGMDILHADIRSVLALSDMPDGTHPNNAGQQKIAMVEPG